MPDWTGLIEPVALALLGPPNARLSSRIRGDLRFGNKGSLSVRIPPHRDAGRWKNYEEGTGGGVLDLIADRTGSGRAGAVSWLERNGLALDKLSPKPPPEAPGRKRPTQADDPVAAALRLWASAHPIPADPLHPGRCWLDRRFLWPPGLAPPNQVRWIPGNTGWARNAAGCICVPADQPSRVGTRLAPNAPSQRDSENSSRPRRNSRGGQTEPGEHAGQSADTGKPPTGVRRVPRAGMRGGSRRAGPSLPGTRAGGRHAGNRRDAQRQRTARVARNGAPRSRDLGGPGHREERKGAPAGLRAANALARAVTELGGQAKVCHAKHPYKDPAEAAQATGFPKPDRVEEEPRKQNQGEQT